MFKIKLFIERTWKEKWQFGNTSLKAVCWKKKKRKEFCIKEPWQEKINNTSLVRETTDNVFLSILNFVTLEKSWYYFDMKDLYLCQKFKSEKKSLSVCLLYFSFEGNFYESFFSSK